MLEKKEFEIPSEKFKKGATVYTDSDTPVKAAIIYFHGGGLLYGRRKDLPRPHLNTLNSRPDMQSLLLTILWLLPQS